MRIELELLWRWVAAVAGGVLAVIEPALQYVGICSMMILADCWTAWQLGRRVKAAYKGRAHEDAGKFRSHHFGAVLVTLLKSWAAIVLAFLIELHITSGLPFDLTKVAAGAICFWQGWSILENESSCNGARWARLVQKIVVDKTARHLKIDLTGLIDDEKKN